MERTSPSSGAPRQRFPYAGSSVPPSIWTGASTPMRKRHRPKLPIWKWCLRPTTARTKVRSARPATARALAWTETRTEHGEAGAAGGGDAVDATAVKVASVTRRDRETVTTMRRQLHPSTPSRAKILRKRRQLTTGRANRPSTAPPTGRKIVVMTGQAGAAGAAVAAAVAGAIVDRMTLDRTTLRPMLVIPVTPATPSS